MRASSPSVSRRTVLKSLLRGTAATLGAGAAVAQGYGLSLTRHQRNVPGLRRPLMVAFLTDLHYGSFIGTGSVAKWVKINNEQQPDLVLLGGDQFDRTIDVAAQPLIDELAQLRAPLGVFGVWGNHDYGSFGRYSGRRYGPARSDWRHRREQLQEAFGQAGLRILRNEGVALRDDLYLAGVDDLWHGQPDVHAALRGADNRASLLVSHNPDLLPDLPHPAGLVLCGHTHGGQVRLPFVGAVPSMVPSQYGARYAMGWVTGAHGTPAYVSRGLGMSGLPIRNLCPPEIALFHLEPA